MNALTVILLVVAAAVAVNANAVKLRKPTLDGRIIGGTAVSIEEYNWQVSLQVFNSHFCGGSIIGARRILTAAHCTNDLTAAHRASFTIRYGSNVWSTGGASVAVSSIVQHAGYDEDTLENDIAILNLAEDIVFGPGAQAINLASSETATGAELSVSGWGHTAENGQLSATLLATSVNKVDRETCNANYSIFGPNAITEDMLCAGYVNGGRDACQGDSGGPLVNLATRELVGVVSWGFGCARVGFPGVYANVFQLLSWVNSN